MASYGSYDEYRRTATFQAIRETVFARSRGRCEGCGQRATEDHHETYPPWNTWDVPANMRALCHACHCDEHGVTE